jgi:secreted trypsin-like serine protease
MTSSRAIKPALWVLAALAAGGCSAASARVHAPRATPAATQEEWHRYQSSGNTPPEDAVVHVISRGVGCSGTLISNKLVLTAHHCMVERDADGEIIDHDLPASELEVEVGGDAGPAAIVPVSAAVAPPCGYRGGNGDIAVLVLSRRVVGLSAMPVRLADPPRTGELIEPLGFGHCALSSEGDHHIRHLGGPIEELGTFAISAPASICPGDSGGPAQSSLTGEAVGVVSAGVMDDSDQTRDETTFTRLDVWRPLFAKAQLIADGSSSAEVPPISGCQAE